MSVVHHHYRTSQQSIAWRAASSPTWLLLGFVCLSFIAGCQTSEDPKVVAYREKLVTDKQPEGVISIADARQELLEKENKTEPIDVVITGWAGVRDLPAWTVPGKATLMVSEAIEGSHYNAGSGHDPKTCPFCKRRWKLEESMAIIECVDQQGTEIPFDAPTLLHVKEGNGMIFQGKGTLDGDGMLHVKAEKVFLRTDQRQ
jgi:hypothetical protein